MQVVVWIVLQRAINQNIKKKMRGKNIKKSLNIKKEEGEGMKIEAKNLDMSRSMLRRKKVMNLMWIIEVMCIINWHILVDYLLYKWLRS